MYIAGVKSQALFLVVLVLSVVTVMLLLMNTKPQASYSYPKFVYIDLGANNGDSLMSFFGFALLEQGFVGGKLSFKAFGPDVAEWEVHAFEANPFFNEKLERVRKIIQEHHKIQIYNAAAWTFDGKIQFFLDTVNPDHNFWGSSLNQQHPDVVNSGVKSVEVECKDIAKIIDQYTEQDIIVAKIDIEGAEYDLLLDWLHKDVYRLVDYLAVEFHPFVKSNHTKESVLIELIEFMGPKFVQWN